MNKIIKNPKINNNAIIITGASRGIGREIAIKLSFDLKDTDIFILIARNKEKLKETKNLMNPQKKIIIYPNDITNDEFIIKIINEITKKYYIKYYINNAGFVEPASIFSTDVKNWDTTFNVNIRSAFVFTSQIIKQMKNNGGKLLYIASTSATPPRPGWIAYSSSKAALVNFALNLSAELKPYGIKVYCISPGRCATDLRRKLAPEEDQSKIMQPEEVADVVSLLLSKKGDTLDGQNIIVKKQIFNP